jgi:hypothetical protein
MLHLYNVYYIAPSKIMHLHSFSVPVQFTIVLRPMMACIR